jgi:sugar O-acyltransferase (sialic acid O-acetyltransferase NeuD family)
MSLENDVEVVIYGIGSSLLVDVEESLARAGVRVRAGIRNRPGPDFLSAGTADVASDSIAPDLLRLPFVLPFFVPADRQTAAAEARASGFASAFSLIDPTAIVPRDLAHGEGFYVNAGCTLGAGSRFGSFVFINRGATIGHHADFGDYVSIGPGAVLAGNIRMGIGAVVGAGAVLLPEIAIGRNSVVGAGAVVTRDVPDNCLVVGSPASIARSGIAGFRDRGVA